MMRKGQKSLEMIIGLVILLVVAGVVISTFLNQFQNNPGSKYQDTLKKERVTNTCSQLCGDYKDARGTRALTEAMEYCTNTFVMDANGDGTASGKAGTGYNSYCEDGTHCFNIHSCTVGYNKLNAESCAEIMCRYYEQVQKINSSNATTRIKNKYVPSGSEDRTIGTCGLPQLETQSGRPIDTWWDRHFRGNQICTYSLSSTGGGSGGGGGGGGGGSGWCEDSSNSGDSDAVTITNPSGDRCISGAQNGQVSSHYSGTTGELKQASNLPGSSPCGTSGVLYCDMNGNSGRDPSNINW